MYQGLRNKANTEFGVSFNKIPLVEYNIYIVYNKYGMGKRYLKPTSYRDKSCPYCGLYFSPRGLNGHVRFKHSRGDSVSPFEMLLENRKMEILGKMNTEEGLKEALRLFLIEYLSKDRRP